MGKTRLGQKYLAAIALTFLLVFSIKSKTDPAINAEKDTKTPPPQNILSPTKNEPNNLGTHLLVEFWNCTITEDPEKLKDILRKAAIQANSIPLESETHKFEPQGITGFIILADSHISVHTWPEKKYAAVDIFTCGKKSTPYVAIEFLKKQFNAEKVEIKEVKRGKEKIKEPTQTFGLELTIDLFDCDKEIIDSKEKILEFNEKLCDLIDMKRYGKPFIERFADGTDAEGYSLAQMIETSLVSGHFAPKPTVLTLIFFLANHLIQKLLKNSLKIFSEQKELKVKIIFDKEQNPKKQTRYILPGLFFT